MGGLFILWFYLLFTTRLEFTNSQDLVKPGCQTKCGDVDIPYPFGLSPNCSMNGFLLNCTMINGTIIPLVFKVEVTDILLSVGRVRMKNHISWQCYNVTSTETYGENLDVNFRSTPYRFSDVYNKFTTIGCETLAFIEDSDGTNPYQSGCVSMCSDTSSIINGSCSGMGCCQTTIPKNRTYYSVRFDPNYNSSRVWNFSSCSYAVLLESDWFDFNTKYITTTDFYSQNNAEVPLLMDWAIGNATCEQAIGNPASYACVSNNSECLDSQNVPGYLCNCTSGYEGNPYLPDGCQDIDECARNDTCPHMKCQNNFGSYVCYCPWGMRYNGKRCSVFGVGIMFVSGVGACVALLLLAYFVFMFIKMYKKGQLEVKMQNNFTRHKDILSRKHPDVAGTMRTFTVEELEKATNKFDRTLIVGTGGHGEVYKGILSDKDKQVVAIKKPTEKKPLNNNNREIEEFLNEAVISSQLNHRNIVKFIGCCLESETPWLVYEFISNGTLADHLHVQQGQSLSWYDRLRIALETAGVLAYLHSAASVSVFHRDIKTGNILLNDGLITKLSDFGASRSVPVSTDEADSTAIQGTFGYLDPEYYETGRLTAKSDVYSFGVILAELLTRKKPIFVGGGSLVVYFRETMREDRLRDILDPQIVDEEEITDLESMAALAEMCLRPKGVERPTMKDVQMRLEMIWSSKIRSAHCRNAHQREQQQPLIESHGSEDRSGVYSSEVELISSASIPR